MNIMVAVVIVISIVFLVIYDHIRFWKQTDGFLDRANDLTAIYNNLQKRIDSTDSEVIEYEGMFYTLTVNKGDYRSFVNQINIIVCDVIEYYNKIDPRYFEQMDEDWCSEINKTYLLIEEIEYALRMTVWENGWK